MKKNDKKFQRIFLSVAALGLLTIFGCGGGENNTNANVSPITLASQEVGQSGADIKTEGLELIIPDGALKNSINVVIQKLTEVPQEYASWMTPFTQVYKLSPEGTKFSSNITTRLYSPTSTNTENPIGILWASSGGEIEIIPYARDGDYLIGKSNHFSLLAILGWRNISSSAWNTTKGIAKLASANAEVAGKVFYSIGAPLIATLCKLEGHGDIGEPPCSGPKNTDGTYDPLCYGPAFSTGSVSLTIDPRTGLCWDPIPPKASASNIEVLQNDRFDGNISTENTNSFRYKQKTLHGTVTINDDGRFVYIPELNYVGKDNFSFVALNEIGASESVTVNIEVKAINVVTSVTPLIAPINKPAKFTVNGINLTEAIVFSLKNCDSEARALPGGTSTMRQFICTPTAAGYQNGLISFVGPDLSSPFEFSVNVTSVDIVDMVDIQFCNGGNAALNMDFTVDLTTSFSLSHVAYTGPTEVGRSYCHTIKLPANKAVNVQVSTSDTYGGFSVDKFNNNLFFSSSARATFSIDFGRSTERPIYYFIFMGDYPGDEPFVEI